jgi:hypothetical protein
MLTDSRPLVYADDADNCIGRWRNVLVVIRRGKQTLEHVRRTRDAVAEYCASSSTPFALLHVYEPGAELPDRDCRRATADLMSEFGSRVACAAVVIEGEGLRGTTLRLVVRSMGALLQSSMRRFICARVDEGVAWLVSALGSDVDADALLDVVTGLRARRPPSALQ